MSLDSSFSCELRQFHIEIYPLLIFLVLNTYGRKGGLVWLKQFDCSAKPAPFFCFTDIMQYEITEVACCLNLVFTKIVWDAQVLWLIYQI